MAFAGDASVLVPVDVSTAEPPAQALFELLEPINVVVLGYYPVPRQTAPAHLKRDHGEEAGERLRSVVSRFRSADHEVEEVLVFTKDRQETIDRVADQHDCDAVFVPGETDSVDRVLVPLRGEVNLDRIVSLVGTLMAASDATVTLFHAAAGGADPGEGETVLRAAADRLVDAGVDPDRIDRQLSESGTARERIVAMAGDHDLVVLGETKPSLRERILGPALAPIIEDIDRPAVVVRRLE
jgi:nucleotide-binding universal stress UspA family protein